jgi:hypothetical protein
MAYCAGTFMMPSLPGLPPIATKDIQPVSLAPFAFPNPGIDGPYRPPRNIFA